MTQSYTTNANFVVAILAETLSKTWTWDHVVARTLLAWRLAWRFAWLATRFAVGAAVSVIRGRGRNRKEWLRVIAIAIVERGLMDDGLGGGAATQDTGTICNREEKW